jgi:hypothetical protein
MSPTALHASLVYAETVNVDTTCTALALKLFIEGYYTGMGIMKPVMANQLVPGATSEETDTITVELRDASSPSSVISSSNAVLMTNGMATGSFDGLAYGDSYWIVIRHRNGIQTWSSQPVILNQNEYRYDFSDAAFRAYGNNMKDVFNEGIWSLYTGDINQDEFIDIFDFPEYDSDNQNFINSVYAATDLNGDGFVDIFDFPVFDVNNQNFIMSLHP